jgi:hypothetical protein
MSDRNIPTESVTGSGTDVNRLLDEIDALRSDVTRHLNICTELATENERLRRDRFNDHNSRPICRCADCRAYRKRMGLRDE